MAGVVEAVGAGVSGVKVGDRVVAMGPSGGIAEKFVTDASRTIPIPDGVDFATAVGLPTAYGTTLHALRDRAQLREGESLLVLGAFMMGAFGCGIWGMAPAYVTERYPTEARGVGPGFCYHAAAAIGALMPLLIGWMDDRGTPLATAMAIPIAIALSCSAALIWLGPETRGRAL